MEKNSDIVWDDEIVLCIYYQELIPKDELMRHINFIQLLNSLTEEAQNG